MKGEILLHRLIKTISITTQILFIFINSYDDDALFKASLLQRVEFTSHNLGRTIVLFCDSNFITNVNSETSSRVTIPSFSAVRYDKGGTVGVAVVVAILLVSFQDPTKSKRSFRLRFQIAPVREHRRFASYLPFATFEHDVAGSGVSLLWIEASSVIDGHFLVPVQGLMNSISYETLPPYATYNTRAGSR